MSAFDKIIGYDHIKAELMQISDMIHHPEVYAALDAKLPQGLLLSGAPGLGKTLMATALMEDSGLPCFTVRRSQAEDEFLKQLAHTFDEAAEAAPSMLLLDDMDKFSSDEFSTAAFTAVQSCIDKVQEKQVFVIATVNNVKEIPDSLLRCGRFDRQIKVQRPNCTDGEQIIRRYLSGKAPVPDISLSDLTQLLSHSSCAQVESALNEAAIYAAYERSGSITRVHLIHAVLKTIHHVPPEVYPVSEEQRKKAAFHEAGHAAMLELVAPGSTAFVTLLYSPTSGSCYGFAYRNRPVGRRVNILTFMSGKAAYELQFGRMAPGCNDDITRAAKLIREKAEELGGSGMLGVNVSGRYSDSEAGLLERETIVRAELERYLFEAKEMLASHRQMVQELAEALLEKQTLLYSEIQAICGRYRDVPAA